jgi:hypothetical protein
MQNSDELNRKIDELSTKVDELKRVFDLHDHKGSNSKVLNLFDLWGWKWVGLNFFSQLVTTTSGTNVIYAFSNSITVQNSPFNLTVVSISIISNDTTAGNITIKNGASTIATVAKGTVSGAITGATSLANTIIAKGSALTVVSSSAGNAQILITYTTV